MNTKLILERARQHIVGLNGHVFDVLEVRRPATPRAAANLAKVVSKLSPLLGNLIEFNTVEVLNSKAEFHPHGVWERQDPGFPDTVFRGSVVPTPGLEIKAWFPFATEITARFKDSQRTFKDENISVALLAWLPEHVIFGRPVLIASEVVPALSVAVARDTHYHNPPDYLVVEPHDTSTRTRNLQQSNTSGYKWQGSSTDFALAEAVVKAWGPSGTKYSLAPQYQSKIAELRSRFEYRLDTNFAKLDRIEHPGIENFKRQVLAMQYRGQSVAEWAEILATENDLKLAQLLSAKLGI